MDIESLYSRLHETDPDLPQLTLTLFGSCLGCTCDKKVKAERLNSLISKLETDIELTETALVNSIEAVLRSPAVKMHLDSEYGDLQSGTNDNCGMLKLKVGLAAQQ